MRTISTKRIVLGRRAGRVSTRRLMPAVLGVILALVGAATASAAPPPTGGLTALAGQAGCVTAIGGNAACAQARGVDGASSATVSPDGRNLYLASYMLGRQDGLAVFSRDPATGALTQLPGLAGCLTADGSSAAGPGTCTAVRGLGVGDGHDLVITSDGRWAYMVNQHARSSDAPAAIVLLRRDPTTGALSQLPGTAGCVSNDGSSQDGPGTCQTLASLVRPFGISISSDDAFVYVSDYGAPSRVHVLARDPQTGGLSEVQCLSEAPAPAGCDAGRVLGNSKSVVLSPDGRHAYSGDGHGVSVFDRDPTTGILTQRTGTAGCVTDTGADNAGMATCSTGRVLSGTYTFTLTPAGTTLYVAASADGGVSVFHVAADGSLTQLPGTDGCITINGDDGQGSLSCAAARALTLPFGVAVSPDGRSLYVTADNNDPADGVAIFSLDATTGAATQLPGTAGCITADGTSGGVSGACANAGPGLEGIYDPTVSPDGTAVYLPGYDGETLGVYRRETGPTCQATSGTTPYQTAATLTLRCTDNDGDPVNTAIASQPAHGTLQPIDPASGAVVYTPQARYSGPDSFTFAGSDGTNATGPATATIVVAPPVLKPSTGGSTRPKEASALKLTQLRLSSDVLREVRVGRSRQRVTLSFVVNQAARVTLTFTRKLAGRRARTMTLGALTLKARAGRNRVQLDGRLPRRGWLPLGRITVTAVASTAGRRSAPRRLTLVITGRTQHTPSPRPMRQRDVSTQHTNRRFP